MLSIGSLGTTMMTCANELADQERALLVQLDEIERFDVDVTGALVLSAADGDRILAKRR